MSPKSHQSASRCYCHLQDPVGSEQESERSYTKNPDSGKHYIAFHISGILCVESVV